MVQGQLIKYPNIWKWILQTKSGEYGISVESDQFVIQNCKCCFSFYYGIIASKLSDSTPLSLMIRLNGNQKLNSPMEVLILVSSTSKMFPPETHTIAGKCEVKIWSSFDYDDIRGSLMTFEMITLDSALKDDKEVQTPPYIDANTQLEAVTKDFSTLLDAGPNHDVEFLCGDKTIKAHKNVISCRSAVFASMLETDMQEGKTGQIKIQDMETSILHQFLRYLYTGVLCGDSTFDSILRMYQAADKYAVKSLKEQCASFLMDNLCHENACEVLILSDRHNDSDLKNAAIDYMLKEEIPQRIGEKWIDFSKENLALANEVLYKFYMEHYRTNHVSEKQ